MYERHLRRVRRRNTARRDVLLDAISRYLADKVEVTGQGAGAHVVLWPGRRISENAAVEKAASRGVGIYGISPYFSTKPVRAGLMLGYSRMREVDIREGIRRLGGVL
jgi:GntR family transcriptional regulator/MocR family aminotransferase